MPSRYVFFLFMLVSGCCAMGQDIYRVNKEIQKIDSLIKFNQFGVAERKSDSLFALIGNSDLEEQILRLRLQKAKLIDNRSEYAKALKIYLEVLSKSEKLDLHYLACESNIWISLIHEKNDDFDLAYSYIQTALEQSKKFGIEELYSTILIRLSSIHRIIARNHSSINLTQIQRLEKLGFKASLDSSFQLAVKAIPYAQKYNRVKDLHDCYFLMGAYYSYAKKDKMAIAYFLKDISYVKKIGGYETVFMEYSNISRKYLQMNEPTNALKYNDSAYKYYNKVTMANKYFIAIERAEIFKTLNQTDSAYHYLQLAFDEREKSIEEQKRLETRKLEEQFQDDKKEETITNKNRLIILVTSLLLVIAVAAVIVISKNRQINIQNKVIGNQVIDLKKTLEQKQILLSELQHRVKNNLQYVISILEIQKESVSHSNLDDLIRSNQNRIHSIALLHKKLNLTDSVNDVDLKRYVTDLSELVKDSYDNKEKNISLFIACEIEVLSITKALPLGLIIVELVSNSMKYAFKNQQNGIINIEIMHDENTKKNCLHYIDNGEGFDFKNIETKGLGIEIMKGLIDQLNGKVEAPIKKGFDLKIYF